MGRVVLVTGAAGDLGERLLRLLHADPDVDLAVGVDAVPPRRALGGARFVRAEAEAAVLGRLITEHAVDTVAHLAVPDPFGEPRSVRSDAEAGVTGTLELLAAVRSAPAVRRLVLRSSTAVYGSGPGDPALFDEQDPPPTPPAGGPARAAVEIEDHVRGFATGRPDVEVAVLRLADVVGPGTGTALGDLLTLPVVPTVFGHDPRLQFLHADDAAAALALAVRGPYVGTVNVAGDGVLMLSQCLRRGRRVGLPVPAAALPTITRALDRPGAVRLGPDDVAFLSYGRGVDTRRMRDEFGFVPARTTASAFASLARAAEPVPAPGATP